MDKVRIIQLPKNGDRRGNLSVIEECKQIPFKIEQSFLRGVQESPSGEMRLPMSPALNEDDNQTVIDLIN